MVGLKLEELSNTRSLSSHFELFSHCLEKHWAHF